MSKNYNTELLPEEIIQAMKNNIYHNYLYFKSFSDINQKYLSGRSSLFSLIHKISNRMNFKSSTYFLSIYYLDLIFLKNKIPIIFNDNYELLGLSCLVLAAKHLENDPTVPHLKYFVNAYNYITKQIVNNYFEENFYNFPNITFNDLFLSEVLACKMLNYKLNYFTIYDFNSFFFGHGILKIEQLIDINDDYESSLEQNNNTEEETNYINPDMVKRILEKIYKKSRYYLDNVVKNKISLKYNSFLISIYIMNKSVENVILKENKIICFEKNLEKYYIEKKEEILKRKTLKYFKEIMRDIYKIDLDSIEEYQLLLNDEELSKIFYPLKYNNKIILNNNKNEFDISEKIDKIHRKFLSNVDFKAKNNKLGKTETIENKKFSPKKISHVKIPSEKYNKIRRLKILERLNKNPNNTSKNKFTKSFIQMNSKDNISKNKTNKNNIKNNNKKILNNSYYTNDIQYYNSNKNYRNKTINIDNYNSKYMESYNTENKNAKQYQNNTSFIKNSNLKESLITDNNLELFPTLAIEREKKIYKDNLDDSQLNKINLNQNSSSNSNLINLIEKLKHNNNNDNLINTIKPYSRKVVPKLERKIKNNQIINKRNNLNTNTNKFNKSFKDNSIYNHFTTNNLDLRNSNANNYKNNKLEKNLYDSNENKTEYSTNITSNYGRINLNMIKKANDNEISSYNQKNKIRNIHLPQKDNKKSSVSVNKIKVNGVSNKHKLNKKLIFGTQKTPMKTEHIIRNAIKRNIGVRRGNNISVIDKNNSLDNSIEEPYKNEEKNLIKNEDRSFSFINYGSNKDLNISNIDSNQKIINLKNRIKREIMQNNSSSNLITNKINRNNDISSSSDGEYFDANENNCELNNERINQYPDNNIEKYIDNIKYNNDKKYKIKRLIEKENIKFKDKNIPKIELIQINKKKSPTIVINNNINVNFDNKSMKQGHFINSKGLNINKIGY